MGGISLFLVDRATEGRVGRVRLGSIRDCDVKKVSQQSNNTRNAEDYQYCHERAKRLEGGAFPKREVSATISTEKNSVAMART
jgi:hypothetical protein